jgi:hypothetical protein
LIFLRTHRLRDGLGCVAPLALDCRF